MEKPRVPKSLCGRKLCTDRNACVYFEVYIFFSFSFLKLPELQDPFVTVTGINPTDTYV